MLGLLVLLLIGAVTAVAVLSVALAHRLTHPPRKTYAWAVARGRPGTPMELPEPRDFEARTLSIHGLTLPAWWIPGDRRRGPVVVFTPGWGDSKLGVLPRLGPLASRASAVLAWDPPGLGEASGTCGLGVTEPALLAEIVEQLVASDATVAERGVVLFGSSLGAGVSIVVAGGREGLTDGAERFSVSLSPAARGAIVGVIAEAPYRLAPTPARNVMRLSGLPFAINGPVAFAALGVLLPSRMGRGSCPRRWGWRGFDRMSHARGVACPLLVLHPGEDEVSPPEDGEAIARASAEQGRFIKVPGAGHNTMWTDEATRGIAADEVAVFLESLSPGR